MEVSPSSNSEPQSLARAQLALAQGRPFVVLDDAGTAHLAFGAAGVTADSLAFLMRHGSGVVCAVMPEQRLDALELPAQPIETVNPAKAQFAVTVDLVRGVTTGISAGDRAATLRALADPTSTATEFCRPGHILPVRAMAGGVLRRRDGHHAALDVALLANATPCVVVDALVDTWGGLLSGFELSRFVAEHDLPCVNISQVASARREAAPLVRHATSSRIQLAGGVFTLHGFEANYEQNEHVAMATGFLKDLSPDLVRTHVHCWLGSLAGTQICSCQSELDASIDFVRRAGRGVVIVLDTLGSGTRLQCGRRATADAVVVSQILDELGVSMTARTLRVRYPQRRTTTIAVPASLSGVDVVEVVAS